MTPEMQKFIELLESQLGYSERSSGYTKFGEWYGKNVEFDADYSAAPWCEMYLSWAAHKLGYEEWIGQFAWTVAHAKWFKEQGAWGKTPKPGALVYYDWSGSNNIDRIDHVGIVTRVEGGTIFTIEGNIDGGVAKRKERDTSKVVGYGYPERIKARLDEEAARQAEEAKKKAEEQAKVPPGPGTDVGVLQMPGESLTAMIPQDGRGEAGVRPPLAARPHPSSKTDKPTAASSPAPSATSSAAAAGQSAKMGKHAKPTTADTTAATAEPLPTHVDASATSPLPSLDSPTLIGSALVAALALLAVAKTRQNRLRPAAAAASASGPARTAPTHRRRKRRGAAEPVSTPARTRRLLDTPASTAAVDLTTADLTTSDLTTAGLTTAGLTTAGLAARAEAVAGDARATDRAMDAEFGSPADAGTRATGRGSGQARRLLDMRPFDPFADAAPHRARIDRTPDRHSADRVGNRHADDTGAFTPAFDTGSFGAPLDTGPFEPCWDTGPMRRIRDTDSFEDLFGPGPSGYPAESPLSQPAAGTGPLVCDTGPFQRVVIPGATSAFDAFTPNRGEFGGGDILDVTGADAAAYRGRRRRQAPPVEERFADLAPRGRRHRAGALPPAQDDRELVGAINATSTGRPRRGRHRA
jgi:hypothetical protein